MCTAERAGQDKSAAPARAGPDSGAACGAACTRRLVVATTRATIVRLACSRCFRRDAPTHACIRAVRLVRPCPQVVAPNCVAYASPASRPGVLPRMLKEILDTRVMAKQGIKRHAADRVRGSGTRHSAPTFLSLKRAVSGGRGRLDVFLRWAMVGRRGRPSLCSSCLLCALMRTCWGRTGWLHRLLLSPSPPCVCSPGCARVQVLQRVLNARQFGLKMIANVT